MGRIGRGPNLLDKSSARSAPTTAHCAANTFESRPDLVVLGGKKFYCSRDHVLPTERQSTATETCAHGEAEKKTATHGPPWVHGRNNERDLVVIHAPA